MAWSWVRVSTGTSPKLKECMERAGDQSARQAEACIREIVGNRNGRVDSVRFEPNGKRAKVRFWWDTYEQKQQILFDLQGEDAHDDDLLSAAEMDELRARLR